MARWCGRARSLFGLALSAVATGRGAGAGRPGAMRQEIDQLRKEFDALKANYERASGCTRSQAPGPPPERRLQPPAARPRAPPPVPVPARARRRGRRSASDRRGRGVERLQPVDGRDRQLPRRDGTQHGQSRSRRWRCPSRRCRFRRSSIPYARADFFLAFGEEGVDLEEGFITFPTLPGGLLMKVGKMRSAFGKVNTLHTHVLPWTRPAARHRRTWSAARKGITDAGLSVARLIPNPWVFLEATGQVFRGDSEDVFQSRSAAT